MIEVRELTKRFGDSTAVDHISFQVPEGETLVLLGTSGCGKTTTLRMLNRLIEPDVGTILINGQNTSSQKPEILRRHIGYVIQQTGLFPHYTVAENIAVVPRLLQWSQVAIRQRIHDLADMLQLPVEILSHYPSQLSGGQQQRVGLARALAADPPVLLMDEPFGALDPVTRSSIRREFRTIEALRQKTIVLVTHDVQEAFELGNRIGLMNKGKMVQLGSPADLLFHPAGTFVQHFLADQQLILEMKALRVRDFIKSADLIHPDAHEVTEIAPEASLWDVLQNISGRSQTPYFQLQVNGDTHIIHKEQLWQTLLER